MTRTAITDKLPADPESGMNALAAAVPTLAQVTPALLQGGDLLWLAIVFFVLAIVAGLAGFRGIAGLTMEIARILVLVFLVLAVIAFIL